MDFTNKDKGFLPTSTPIRKPYENGQRSSNRLRWVSRTNSLSPIKEVTPFFKQKFENFVDSANHQTFENSIDNLDTKQFNPVEAVKVLCDSGYGSYNKLRTVNRTNSLSPIKEITPFKKRLENFIDSGGPQILDNSTGYLDERHFNTIEVVKELDFNNTFDSLTESCHISISDYYVTNTEEDSGSQNCLLNFQLKDLSDDKIIVLKKKPNNQQHYEVQSEQFLFENIPFPLLTNKLFPEDIENYKLKHRKVDFLGALREKNLPLIITNLLSFIPTEDLSQICCVNKSWNTILRSDTKAYRRLQSFLKEKNSQKENKHPAVSVITPDGRSCLRQGEHKSAFCNVSNVVAFMKQPLKKNCNTKFDSFLKAGEHEKQNLLMKCPRCDYAARNLIGDEYVCTECNYEFCKECRGPFLKNHICSKSMVSMVIGSKKSKRNLKRL